MFFFFPLHLPQLSRGGPPVNLPVLQMASVSLDTGNVLLQCFVEMRQAKTLFSCAVRFGNLVGVFYAGGCLLLELFHCGSMDVVFLADLKAVLLQMQI